MIINQDTILKLVFRQGSDNDRRKVIFTTGEPVYSTNTRRLYVGNGSLSGGDVVGNRFLGHTPNLTTLTENSYAVEGDLGFVSDTNKLYALSGSAGGFIGNWKNIGGVYSSDGVYINISPTNILSLNPLSANSLSVDLTQSPIYLNSGRIGLRPLSANHVSSDLVTGPLVVNNGRIGLPPLSAHHVSSDLVTGPLILTSGRIGLSSTIPYQSVSTKTILVSSGLVSTANGVNSTGIAVNPLSSNIVIQSNQLYAKFNGSLDTLAVSAEYSQNITTATRLSGGHYKFTYGPLPTANLIPMVQLFGNASTSGGLLIRPNIEYISQSACEVRLMASDSYSYDADIAILITY